MKNKNNQARLGLLVRLFKDIFSFYPVLLPVTILCIIFCALVSSIPVFFMQPIIALIASCLKDSSEWSAVSGQILSYVGILAGLYVLSLASGFLYNQLLAIMTQGTLMKMRKKMFDRMQTLPVKYFDTNHHGDVMSYYTNDIDALRQMISQSLPQMLNTAVVVITLLISMLYYSVWMTLVVVLGVTVMTLIVKKIGGGSARFFFRQQRLDDGKEFTLPFRRYDFRRGALELRRLAAAR